MAIEAVDSSLCNGCGICVESCPTDVLRMDDQQGLATIRYRTDCMTCFNCEADCPTGAIYVGPERACEIPFSW